MFSALGYQRRFRAAVCGALGRARFRVRYGGRHHRPNAPACGGSKGGTSGQALGRSRGGLTTKIVALVDALGILVRFVLLPGQRHDSIGVAPLIDGVAFDALLGDKGFDYDTLRADLEQPKAEAVIPLKANRKTAIACDFAMYRWRPLIENFCCDIKQNQAFEPAGHQR